MSSTLQSLLNLSLLAFVIIFLITPGLLLLIAIIQRRWPRLRRIAGRLMISYVTIVLLLIAGESYFRYVYADTGGNYRWGNHNWTERYWTGTLNSQGFRDREWSPQDWAGKTRVLAVGDSFTEGWGTKNPADRFTNVLGGLLGDQYYLMNLGQIGWATPDELTALKKYDVQKNDVVILQYYLNDIDPAAAAVYGGFEWPTRDYPPLADESALIGFAYLHLNYGIINTNLVDTKFGLNYAQWTYKVYNDPDVWALHRKQLRSLIDYVKGKGARLIVVIFPHLTEVNAGDAVLDKIAQVFENQDIHDILKVNDVGDWPLNQLISSAFDSHPSVKLHHYVAQQLYDRFFAGVQAAK